MFKVVSTKKSGKTVAHHVKPLQIIWNRFRDRWGVHNTVHVDDLARNFALNTGSGLKIKAYHRHQTGALNESDLLQLGKYMEQLAQSGVSFERIDFGKWQDVTAGEVLFEETISKTT